MILIFQRCSVRKKLCSNSKVENKIIQPARFLSARFSKTGIFMCAVVYFLKCTDTRSFKFKLILKSRGILYACRTLLELFIMVKNHALLNLDSPCNLIPRELSMSSPIRGKLQLKLLIGRIHNE